MGEGGGGIEQKRKRKRKRENSWTGTTGWGNQAVGGREELEKGIGGINSDRDLGW